MEIILWATMQILCIFIALAAFSLLFRALVFICCWED